MFLVSRLGPTVLDNGAGYILTQNNDGYQLLLYNLAKPDFEYFSNENSVLNIRSRYNMYADDNPVRHTIIMNLKKGFYYVKRRSVNRDHGSAYDLWMKMGFPETLNIDMENYLRSASVPEYAINIYEVESTLMLEEEVPAHGVTLLEIQERK